MAPISSTGLCGWRVIAAKATGNSHRRAGKGCDDHFALLTLENGIQLIAVSDGAGSAAYGSVGANIAVEAALEAAKRLVTDKHLPGTKDAWISIMDSVLAEVRNAVGRNVSQVPTLDTRASVSTPITTETTLRDYAATLLCAILSPDRISLLQLGDGMIVFELMSGEYYCPVVCSSDSQYVNVTHFITDSDCDRWAQIVSTERSDIQGIALLTDGLQLLASHVASRAPYPPFFRPLFAFAAKESATDIELQSFLRSERVNQRTDDDRTLVIAVRSRT